MTKIRIARTVLSHALSLALLGVVGAAQAQETPQGQAFSQASVHNESAGLTGSRSDYDVRGFNRIDTDRVGRNGQMIPVDMKVDKNDVVVSATFANAGRRFANPPSKPSITLDAIKLAEAKLRSTVTCNDAIHAGRSPGHTAMLFDRVSDA